MDENCLAKEQVVQGHQTSLHLENMRVTFPPFYIVGTLSEVNPNSTGKITPTPQSYMPILTKTIFSKELASTCCLLPLVVVEQVPGYTIQYKNKKTVDDDETEDSLFIQS